MDLSPQKMLYDCSTVLPNEGNYDIILIKIEEIISEEWMGMKFPRKSKVPWSHMDLSYMQGNKHLMNVKCR